MVYTKEQTCLNVLYKKKNKKQKDCFQLELVQQMTKSISAKYLYDNQWSAVSFSFYPHLNTPPLPSSAALLGEEDDDDPKLSGIGLDDIHGDFINETLVRRRSSSSLNISMVVDSNRALLQHFAKMVDSPHDEAKINLEFVESLLNNGADINIRDKCGQTILHEVGPLGK